MAKPSLARNTILLTLSGGVEFALQFAVPMVFVRNLDAAAFGEYRLLWLMAATALALAPAFMPHSLFFFLPRATRQQKRVYIGNVLAYLAVAGAVVAILTSPLNPLLPSTGRRLFADSHGLSSLFLGCWMVVSLMFVLPTAEGRILWQTANDIALAVLRTLLLASAALFTHALPWVMAALLCEAVARLATLGAYLRTRPGGGMLAWQAGPLLTQLRYAVPFAIGNGLFMLRSQADQWIVAGMVSPALFGLFSISAVFMPLAALIRQPVANALMPRLNKAFADGHLDEIARLFRKSSAATTLLLVPLAGGLLCVTGELVQIVYTGRYAEAVPVMRIYLLGMMLQGCAAGYALPALNQGRVAVANNACCLVVSIICSYFGARYWGLRGAATGSMIAFVVSELWSLLAVARTLRVSPRELLPWRTLRTAGLASGAALFAVWLLQAHLAGPALLLLTLKGLVFLAVFAAVFFATGGMAELALLGGAVPFTSGVSGRAEARARSKKIARVTRALLAQRPPMRSKTLSEKLRRASSPLSRKPRSLDHE
jgi:O-antigen/teichoic acid export membrane protein